MLFPGYSGPVARAATPAIAVLLAAGAPHDVLQYKHDPRNDSFGEEAVAELAGVAGVTIAVTAIVLLVTGSAATILNLGLLGIVGLACFGLGGATSFSPHRLRADTQVDSDVHRPAEPAGFRSCPCATTRPGDWPPDDLDRPSQPALRCGRAVSRPGGHRRVSLRQATAHRNATSRRERDPNPPERR